MLSDEALYLQVRRLPGQLDRARRRVERLEERARRYRMFDLIERKPE